MKIYFKKILLFSVMMCFVFILYGCNKKDKYNIVVSEVAHSIFYAPMYVALEEGYFEEEGLNVELILGNGANNVMASLLSGDAQIGLADEDFKWDNLKGKSILGGRQGGMPVMVLEYVLKQNGLLVGQDNDEIIKQGGVNVRTDVQFAALAGAFTSGEGDYVTLFEPKCK